MTVGFETGSSLALPIPPLPEDLFPALKEADFDTLANFPELNDILYLELPQQPEDARIASLEQFLASAATKSLLNQFTDETLAQSKTELKNLLEPCKAILNPNQRLQFLRHLALQFLSEKTAFSCQFTSQPNQLPAGVALSWVANHPVKVDVANPVMRALLQHALNPSEYGEHYDDLIRKLILACVAQAKTENRTEYLITFGQLHIEYEYRFHLNEFWNLFFSAHLENAQICYPDRNITACCRLFRLQVHYHYCDPRFAGKVPVTYFFFDNLLLSGAMVSFAPFFIRVAPDGCGQLEEYVTQLLAAGVIGSETLLPDQIIRSLFFLVSVYKGHIKQPRLAIIFDAFGVVTEKRPELAAEINDRFGVKQLLQGYTVPENYKSLRQQFSNFQSKSILIRDLQVKSGIDPKKLPQTLKFASLDNGLQVEVAKFLQSFVSRPTCSVICTEAGLLQQKARSFLERALLVAMHAAWNRAAARFSKQLILEKYLAHLKNYTREKHENQQLDQLIGSSILGLLPLVDENLLFKSAAFWDLIPSQMKSWAIDRLMYVINLASTEQYRAFISSKLRDIIPKTLKWVSLVSKGVAFQTLLNNLSTKLDGDVATELRALMLFLSSAGERDKTQQFAEILFCGHIASIGVMTKEALTLPDAVLDHFLLFTKDQIQVCHDLAAYEKVAARSDKRILCVTTQQILVTYHQKGNAIAPSSFIRGLTNKENNCFINASLQALLRVKAFQKRVETPLEKSEPLQQMLQDLLTHKQPELAHSQILDFLYNNVADLKQKRGAIHDATPVIEEILDRLKYKQSYQVTYQGLNDKRHLHSIKQTPIYVLSIPIIGTRPQMQSLLKQAFTKKFVHDEKNPWKAGPEGQEISLGEYSITHSLVEPLADLLVIQLERGYWSRVNGEIHASLIPVGFKDPIVIGSGNYVLRACINYHSEIKHYTADVLHNGNWYRCDDTAIMRIQQPSTQLSYLYILEKV